jgi:lysophospholipase L1-like esterase
VKPFWLNGLKFSLGPLLWFQGQRVRKRIPLLPEPMGDRIGQSGSGQPLRLLIMGDSSAAGVGVYDQHDGLLGQTLQTLKAQYQIDFELRARTGAKTRDALTDLNHALTADWPPDVRFDVVVIALGVNDVTGQVGFKKWCQQQHSLFQSIHQKLKPKHLIVSGLPPMHLFPALPTPLRQYMGAWANLFNDELRKITSQYPLSTFLAVRDLPAPKDVASDGFHPGPQTYQKWGQAVAEIIHRVV